MKIVQWSMVAVLLGCPAVQAAGDALPLLAKRDSITVDFDGITATLRYELEETLLGSVQISCRAGESNSLFATFPNKLPEAVEGEGNLTIVGYSPSETVTYRADDLGEDYTTVIAFVGRRAPDMLLAMYDGDPSQLAFSDEKAQLPSLMLSSGRILEGSPEVAQMQRICEVLNQS